MVNYVPVSSVQNMIDRYNNLCDEIRLLAKELPHQGGVMQVKPFVRELERMLLRAGSRMVMPEVLSTSNSQSSTTCHAQQK